MRRFLPAAFVVAVLTFLLVTNPVVADAARTITGRDIKDGSITGKDVRNRSLKSVDFARGQLPAGPKGADGMVGTAWADFRYDRDSGATPVKLPADGTLGDVVTLTAGPSRHSGAITVRQSSLLFVSADAYLNNNDVTSRSLHCVLELRRIGGGAVPISFASYDVLDSYESRTWSQSVTQAVGAGTYDVALRCSTGNPNNGGRVYHADLNVLAARTS